jgi:hypothetical protein
MIESENRVQFIVGQTPVACGDRAQHVGIEGDLVERDGVVKAVVEVISHALHLRR